MLERYFQLTANGTTIRTEIMAGVATFLTMSYIIFVQPAVLSGTMFNNPTGMDFGAVMVATCLASALATAIMGLYARYPVALAPGMGHNFFFVLTALPAAAVAGFEEPWRVLLGVVFIEGILFVFLALGGIRERMVNTISPSMKHGIAVGIGLFIAFIGLQNAGLVVKSPGTAVRLNPQFASPDLIVFFTGMFVTATLAARRRRGAILAGIAAATGTAILLKLGLPRLGLSDHPLVAQSMLASRFHLAGALMDTPPSLTPTLLKMDLTRALSFAMWPFIAIFLFMDFFDTLGTLIGVSQRAGILKNNALPRAKEAFLSDAFGTAAGAVLGTSTVTSYIESAAGVEEGGRTGLVALVVSAFFLLALFFGPLVEMVGSYPAITAPALVIVGSLMARSAVHIDWEDFSESIPAFITLLCIPLTYSIGDGLALGFISYPLVKLFSGRRRDVSWLMYGLAAVLVVYFVLIRSRMG